MEFSENILQETRLGHPHLNPSMLNLGVTRAIGDFYFKHDEFCHGKKSGLSAEPEIIKVPLTTDHAFLLLASDGKFVLQRCRYIENYEKLFIIFLEFFEFSPKKNSSFLDNKNCGKFMEFSWKNLKYGRILGCSFDTSSYQLYSATRGEGPRCHMQSTSRTCREKSYGRQHDSVIGQIEKFRGSTESQSDDINKL